ncbi:MAG: hypothetical protein SFX72_14215 [Isosphaeraceae bacterium]|nr:hypothetical protein [Isosphaeraceae bacterium]
MAKTSPLAALARRPAAVARAEAQATRIDSPAIPLPVRTDDKPARVETEREEWRALFDPANVLASYLADIAFEAKLRHQEAIRSERAKTRLRVREVVRTFDSDERERAEAVHEAYRVDPETHFEAMLATRDGSHDIHVTALSLREALRNGEWGSEENEVLIRVEGRPSNQPDAELDAFVELFDQERKVLSQMRSARFTGERNDRLESWKLELHELEPACKRGRSRLEERLGRVLERAEAANRLAREEFRRERELRADAALIDDSPAGRARLRYLRDTMKDSLKAIETAAAAIGPGASAETPAPASTAPPSSTDSESSLPAKRPARSRRKVDLEAIVAPADTVPPLSIELGAASEPGFATEAEPIEAIPAGRAGANSEMGEFEPDAFLVDRGPGLPPFDAASAVADIPDSRIPDDPPGSAGLDRDAAPEPPPRLLIHVAPSDLDKPGDDDLT